MARYDLNQLDPQSFTELCNALLHRVISEQVTPGPLLGRDAGIDAYYEGPGKGDWATWDGAWIFQYKFHNVARQGVDKCRKAVQRDVESELEKVFHRYHHQADHYILITNVPYATTPGSAARKWLDSMAAKHANDGLQRIELWDLDKLNALLDSHHDLLQRFLGVSPGISVYDYLSRAVTDYERRMYKLVARSAAPPNQPYKFLYAFEIKDADIFFGRDAATEDFYQTILKDRLTVLHAKSGAGKTSLLKAGLSPRLIYESRLPIYARAYEDPILAVKRAIAPPSYGPWPAPLPQLPLHEFLGLVCTHLSRQVQELVIILDQFEELFVLLPEQELRQPFINALADCYDDAGLRVRFVIGIRSDYFSHLATFRNRLPHVFHNEYYLEAMTREEALMAITGPVAELGRPVVYKQALLDALLDDLARDGMELPHLQIVCTRLYEALAEGETTINLAPYKQLGGVEGVLGSYLNEVLDRLPGKGWSIAREVLKELVSSETKKRVLSYGTLAARVEAEENELDSVLTWLVDARLLRRDEVKGKTAYEMVHEYLIEEIGRWVDQIDQAFKQAEELLAREVANWSVYGTLIPWERLKLLYAQRERFRGLDDDTWECLLRSALQTDFGVVEWARLAGETGEKVLLIALDDTDAKIRRRVVNALGKLGTSCAVEPLITALKDSNLEVRREVVESLGEIGDTRAVEPLSAVIKDNDWRVRAKVVEALDRLGEPAVEPLSIALNDYAVDVRRKAVKALGKMGGVWAANLLIVALEDRNAIVRAEAAEALGKLGDARVVEQLVVALGDGDRNVRVAVVGALREFGEPAAEPLVTVLKDSCVDVREKAAEALGELGDALAVGPLIAALRDSNQGVRMMVASALGKLGDARAVGPLIAALRDSDRDVRATAAGALGKLGDARAVGPLIAALGDSDRDVRATAAGALGKLGNGRAVEPLIAALGDSDRGVRMTVVGVLGGLGESVVVPLLSILKGNDWDMREWAVQVLGKLGESAVEPLIAALNDSAVDVRWWMVQALGELGDPRVVEPLINALNDSAVSVQMEAVKALCRIGTPEALDAVASTRRRGIGERKRQ